MRFLVYALVALAISVSSLTALAQPRVPDPSQEQIDSARGFAFFREKVALNDALFGMGRLPAGCARVLIDPSQPPSRFNWVIRCPGELTWCDVAGVDCEDDAP